MSLKELNKKTTIARKERELKEEDRIRNFLATIIDTDSQGAESAIRVFEKNNPTIRDFANPAIALNSSNREKFREYINRVISSREVNPKTLIKAYNQAEEKRELLRNILKVSSDREYEEVLRDDVTQLSPQFRQMDMEHAQDFARIAIQSNYEDIEKELREFKTKSPSMSFTLSSMKA